MYYPDLTPYRYIERESAPTVLNVGWLDAEHPFPKKKASEEVLDALFEKCLHLVMRTQGLVPLPVLQRFCRLRNGSIQKRQVNSARLGGNKS